MQDERYPFVIVDAMVLKVREEERMRARGVLLAIEVNEKDYREVLGFMLGDRES
jgi:transposase-like protein